MAKVNIQPKGTIEAEIRECLRLNADKAAADGLSKEQEEQAEQRIRVMREQFEAKIHELEELASQADQRANEQARERYRLEAEIKELRLELGRYMDCCRC